MIPRILHFIWIGSELPSWARRNIEEWERLCPGFDVILHNESSLLPCLADAYANAKAWCSRADLLRYSILQQHGGWYFDVDFWPLRPLEHAYYCWDLSGARVFCSKQQGHKSGARLPYNNAPLACAPGAPGMLRLVEYCQALGQRKDLGRVALGPELMSRVLRDAPHDFLVSEAGWWFPVAVRQGADAYSYFLNDGDKHAMNHAGTAGHVPFAAHLWADQNDMAKAMSVDYSSKPLALAMDFTNPRQFVHSVASGLERIGYQVQRCKNVDEAAGFFRRPSVVVGWNGIRDPRWWQYAEENGAVHLACEHGYFHRELNFQCDHMGFLHRSSLRDRLRAGERPPADADKRLAACGAPAIEPMRPRESGYCLVLGQVDGDTQLVDSEVPGYAPLLRQLSRHMPGGIDLVYRPHPLMATRHANAAGRWPRIRMHRNPDPQYERQQYCANKVGTSLADDLRGARFCVAINSNALVEATAAGIPCMAFGPALGIDAGVYLHATIATLTESCRAMLDGWAPSYEAVKNYLRWLACYQYTREEIEQGDALAAILQRAGASLPQQNTETVHA